MLMSDMFTSVNKMASIDSGTAASVVSVIKSASSLSYDDKLKFKKAGRPTPVI